MIWLSPESILDGVQLGLDVGGMIPGLGEPLDLINIGIALARGKWQDAAFSLAAMAPIGGQAATAAKLGRKAGAAVLENLDKADEAIAGLSRMGDELLVTVEEATSVRYTGGRILNPSDPDSWDIAEEIYAALRHTTDDIEDIVGNSNLPRNVVERVKNHIFHKQHLLDDGIRQFDADPEIANAWQRLREGVPMESDLRLFRHEHAESLFEQFFGGPYRRAHDAVSTRWPSGL